MSYKRSWISCRHKSAQQQLLRKLLWWQQQRQQQLMRLKKLLQGGSQEEGGRLMAGQGADGSHSSVAATMITRASSLSRHWCVLAVQELCLLQPRRWWLQRFTVAAGTWIDALLSSSAVSAGSI